MLLSLLLEELESSQAFQITDLRRLVDMNDAHMSSIADNNFSWQGQFKTTKKEKNRKIQVN